MNSIAFNPHDVNILASASSDKTAGLWDVRALDKKLHSFEYHEDQVFNVAWAPFASNILATSRYVLLSKQLLFRATLIKCVYTHEFIFFKS